MIIGGLCPSTEIWGGVRRYFELGNSLIDLGHKYTFYYERLTRAPWLEFKGKLLPIAEAQNKYHDILFTGARECFQYLLDAKAALKMVLVVSETYTRLYEELYKRGGKDYLWVGVSNGWDTQFKNFPIKGYTCPGGVNSDFFVPNPLKRPEGVIRCSFYGKQYDPSVLDFNLVTREISKFIDRNGSNKIEFVAYDSGHLSYPPFIRTVINRDQEELREQLQSSHIIISAKTRGRWNNNAIESLACGTPVICFSNEAVDFMKDEITGRFITKDFSICDALEWFMEDRRRIMECGDAGRIQAEKFSWKIHTNNLLKIIEAWKTNGKK